MYASDEIKILLDEKAVLYNSPLFIETDPIQIPREFSKKEDIEISAFLTATIAWGQRPVIIKNAAKLIRMMDNSPFEFISKSTEKDFLVFKNFKHRTFNDEDCRYFILSLQNIYRNQGGLQKVFETGYQKDGTIKNALAGFYSVFFEPEGLYRTRKHVSNVAAGAAAKRLNMFLRWMVRKDRAGVDFGLWGGIPASDLMLPLDVHSGTIARKLGLLTRKQNDWKAVEEVTANLRGFDLDDPIKYDFALFGLGAFENY
jgi:uncharacterized protein (TIGR02757 family)